MSGRAMEGVQLETSAALDPGFRDKRAGHRWHHSIWQRSQWSHACVCYRSSIFL